VVYDAAARRRDQAKRTVEGSRGHPVVPVIAPRIRDLSEL
jgi:hypothetical protein